MLLAGHLYSVRWRRLDNNPEGADYSWINDTECGGVYRLTARGMLQRAYGRNSFSEAPFDVPDGAVFEEATEEQYAYFTGRDDGDADNDGGENGLPPGGDNGLPLDAWIDHVHDECLTIGDVLNFVPGQRVELLCMDRNLCDVVFEVNAPNMSHTPRDFFRFNRVTYVHERRLEGKFIFHFEEVDNFEADFTEFDVEYCADCWYPLTNGTLPAQDDFDDFIFDDHMPRSWTDFPETTRVGWRGPMLLWDVAIDQPNILR